MLFIWSSVIRWRLGCMPSRNVMSCTVIFLPCKFMVVLCGGSGKRRGGDGRGSGLECEAAGEDFFRKHFSGAGGGGRHDVEVAGVLGQVVAQAFDFHVNRDPVAVEHRAVDQSVTG